MKSGKKKHFLASMCDLDEKLWRRVMTGCREFNSMPVMLASSLPLCGKVCSSLRMVKSFLRFPPAIILATFVYLF